MATKNSVPLRILLVEDSEHDRLAFRRALKKSQAPAKITECERAEKALERLKSDAASFDLVVTDYKLPGMSGLDLYQELVEEECPLPVVMLTGTGTESLAVEALKAGVDDYIIKDPDRGYLKLLPVVLPHVVQKHNDRLARERAEESLRQRNRELDLLNRVSQKLTATLDLQQVKEQLLQEVTEIIGAEGASVWLWDTAREGELVCQAIAYGQKHFPHELRLRPGQGIASWVARTEECAIVPHAREDPRFFPGIDELLGCYTRSVLAVPLRTRGKVIGALEVVNKLSGDFEMADLALVETLAASAASAIENARLHQALRDHARRLEQEILERERAEAALRQHALELEARNEELDAFAHTVAHDLKSPLTHIIGFAQTLAEDHARIPGEELEKYLKVIARNGRKMENITDELFLLASVRKEEVKVEPLDMSAIVAEAKSRLADIIAEHQAEIAAPERWPEALGYGPWVEEVWVNYLSNAIKYGGKPPRVELGATGDRFWVRDNGDGLKPEEKERLFTPFTRLDQVRAKGYGLGLSIVRRIVEKLGGQIGVESQEGQGSTFWFTLRRNV